MSSSLFDPLTLGDLRLKNRGALFCRGCSTVDIKEHKARAKKETRN